MKLEQGNLAGIDRANAAPEPPEPAVHPDAAEKQIIAAMGHVAAGIAHEVCNPLSSISSIVQLLKRRGVDRLAEDQLELIEAHIRRISQTVRQLVSLDPPGPEQWEAVDLREVLSEAVRLIRFDRRARRVEIAYESPAAFPMVLGVRGQLAQVFLSLLLNALDAMEQAGKLTVRAEHTTTETIIDVADTGCGITPEVGRRVFEPFFTTKEVGKGSGLGLAVSHSIVERHGGSIDFRSSAGQGTVFTVRIPVLGQRLVETPHGSRDDTVGR
jgi:signal transduction histidine kinase